MDFKFNVNRLLPRKINKITHSLIPEDFRGDRRELNEYQRQLSRILDEMGEASARAQGLSKPITSAMKLRDTDHIVYFLVDREGNGGLGSIVGLLKTGSKNLFMFDEMGLSFQLKPRCVLDFYIHETRQRMGAGKILYQHMLTEERITPVKLAIDRPSEKFLQFLNKHYGLEKIIPQNNKFVVFQGFFNDEFQDSRNSRYNSASPSLGDGTVYNNNEFDKPQSTGMNNGQTTTPHSAAPRSAYGRYAAARPPCSMANIIHNTPVFGQTVKRTGDLPSTTTAAAAAAAATAVQLERPRSLSLYTEDQPTTTATTTTTTTTMTTTKNQFHEAARLQTPAVVSQSQSKVSAMYHSSLLTSLTPIPQPQLEPQPLYSKPDESPRFNEPDDIVVTSVPSKEQTQSNTNTSTSTSIVKTSPSCAQEVSSGQQCQSVGHLDLKFYHSPLW